MERAVMLRVSTPVPLPDTIAAPGVLLQSHGPGSVVARMAGLRKAAILLASVGNEVSAAILRHLSDDEIHDLIQEITLLSNVSEQERAQVLNEFLHKIEQDAFFGVEYATSVLLAAFGPEAGKRMAERLLKPGGGDVPSISSLRKADPGQLAKVIHREHPQTIALILCHLSASHAAQLLSALPAPLRADVTKRMAALDQISPEIVGRIAKTISSKMKLMGESSLEAYGGVRAVAEMLNCVDASTSESILEQVSSEDGNLGQMIRHLMFVFDDLLRISKEALTTLLGRVDRKLLTMALKGCNPDIKKHFTSLMSSRAAEMLVEDMQALGPVRIKDVEDAQQKIIATARQLQAEGVISLQSADSEQFVD